MNKAKQKLLDEAFEKVMQVCIYDMDAPLEWIDQYIHPDVTGFGTESDEEVHNIEDCRRLVLKSREQSVGLNFKAAGQVVYKRVSPDEDEVYYAQHISISVTVDGEIMKRELRMSLIMGYDGSVWRMIHFHASSPEIGTSIEDTFNVDSWKTKMTELEKLVAEKTADLALRNKELEIEASLERVRAVAMGMKEPADMLDMCKVISEELKRLSIGGIKLVETIVINEGSDFFLDYEYYSDSDHSIIESFRYKENELILQMVSTILQSEDSFYYGGKIEGAQKADWFAFMQRSGYYVAPELLAANEVHYHFYSVGQAALGLVTDHELSDDEFQLYKRLRNVFALAYRRYRDIEKAEEQAKEAKIEAGLERVRSAANAMKTSEELLQVITVVGQQLENLGLQFDSTNFRTNVGEKDWRLWIYAKWMDQPRQWFVPRIEHPYFFVEEKQGDVVSSVFTREEKDSFEAYLFQLGLIEIPKDPEIAANQKAFIESAKGFAWSIAAINSVSLNIANSQAKPYTPEENALLLRFTVVFEQAYTRFLDLQKAEAQAKEAEIELALERVRARTMAMHQSNELADTALLLSQQLQQLGLSFVRTGFYFWQKDKDLVEGWVADAKLERILPPIFLPFKEDKGHREIYEASLRGELFYEQVLTGDELVKHLQWVMTQPSMPQTLKKQSDPEYKIPEVQYKYAAIFRQGYLLLIAESPEPSAAHLLKRFAKVFEQAYTRFLDLQKKEEQAKEAQIEAALERIRAASMAMHNSEQLSGVIKTVTDQLQLLGFSFETANFITNFTDKGFNLWLSVPGIEHPSFVYVPYADNAFFRFLQQGIALKKDFDTLTGDKAEKDKFFNHFFSKTEAGRIPEERKKYVFDKPGVGFTTAFRKHFYFTIVNYEGHLHSSEENSILVRFANVFEQSYTRFLDLQKAEAQSREAQIELGLERVRARAMAMQHSEELKDLINTVFTELTRLDIVLTRCLLMIYDPATKGSRWWMANSESQNEPIGLFVKYHEHPPYKAYLNAWETKAIHWQYNLQGQVKKEWDDFLFSETELSHLPDFVIAGMKAPDSVILTASFNNFGNLTLATLEPLPEEHSDILLRFAKVFDLTYTRFNDLQKAEEQARESQIQLALERVRARTMAMQKSDELPETSQLLFQQMQAFGETAVQNSIAIVNEADGFVELSTTVQGNLVPRTLHVPINDPHVMAKAVAAWKARQKSLTIQIQGQELKEYNELRNRLLETNINFPEDNWVVNIAFFSKGWLSFSANHPMSEAAVAVLERFAAVFEQTYTRFLDLQKAEQQAREAEIQLSLERVRARTMAMQRSEELTDTVKLLFEEFKNLHSEKDPLTLSRGFILTVNEPEEKFDLWITDIDGSEIKAFFPVFFTEPTHGKQIYQAWKNKQPSIIFDLTGDRLNQWLDYLSGVGFPVAPGIYGTRRVNNFIYHSNGFIGITSSLPLSAEGIGLLERFARVFDLTYTRFTDLLQSETRARQAVKDASLDRVRAEIASMRTTEDLQRITPVIWRELTSLSIPFIRCGVFIMDEGAEQMHCFLSTPEGKSIASFELPFAGEGNLSEVLLHWRKTLRYAAHWQQQDFAGIAATLLQQGRIANEKQYIDTLPADGIHLHFLPFLQGMLYVGNTVRLSDAELDLVQSLAESFSTAYARYEDFNRLEAAKKEVEQTLTELKQTQQQLVQSEKMASLGELTAGIAHEIQNPLNFVNNFSEVSNELIDEMKEELATGNLQLVTAIADDLKENLSKINHHGKRADAIVKGMLQHSRSGSGKKEPTDLNALCDEYLRLAYHGYRAKDKSFNAQFETEFDPALPKVNVMPQDIGRVVLNLINNAFYAVNEKAKNTQSANPPSTYSPKVTVSTKHKGNTIEITVADNGNGIPASAINKIFQPFFTTKPTGQGTGLGLSLSYDIVKAHGGELKVETTESEGTLFIIQLPIQ